MFSLGRRLASGLFKFLADTRSFGWGQVVGLGRFELPTSPLSGVRSNQLSYRPGGGAGGAERDRTDDLLNANQALSQLSYSPSCVSIGAGSFSRPGPNLQQVIEAD
jgi:hypothetical protein